MSYFNHRWRYYTKSECWCSIKIPKILILRSATYLKGTDEAHTKSGWYVKRTYDLPTSFSILRISSSSGLRFNERSNLPIWLQSILPSPCSSKRANASRYSTNKVKIKFLKIHFDKLKRKLMKSHSYHPFRLELVQTSLLWVRWCEQYSVRVCVVYVQLELCDAWWMKCSITQGSPGITGWGPFDMRMKFT